MSIPYAQDRTQPIPETCAAPSGEGRWPRIYAREHTATQREGRRPNVF